MKYPRRTYIIKVGNRIVGLRRFGHHQDGKHEGAILTDEAVPIVVDGVIYRTAHEGNPIGVYYTCHLWTGDDETIEKLTGFRIEEMMLKKDPAEAG